MAGKIFDNIVNMIEKRTKEKISPIQNEKIQNISISQNPDSGYARGDLIPVNFYVDIISLNDSINAKINFNIAQTDENGNPVKVLIYKVYRDTENEEGERAGFPELIAEISSSLITSGVFSFNDNGFPMGNVVYYTITCVDTTGFESPFGEWQRYEDSYPEINNLQLKDFEILEDKSVKINFDIELLRNYSSGLEETGKEIETNNFLELLDFVQVREGNLLIDQFEELSYRFYPDKFSTTLNFRPRTKRGTVSSESLELKIGGTSPDISFDIGSLNAGSCSAEEDVYVNADGSSVSRIKLSLIAGSVVPSEVLIKARRKAISPNPQEAYFVVYDGIYEPELIIEQGASTGWNKIQIGVDYQIQVFVKTSWGLIKDSPDYEEELKIEGSTEPPTPVYFVDGNGNQIETLTTPKYFELDWGESVDFDDDLYVIKISKPEISTWENADHLYTGRATKFVYTPTPEQFASYNTNGTIRFWIKSFNARGTEQDIAKKIDITNNAPSKPNTPALLWQQSGVLITITEKDTINDRDIDYYEIYPTINGEELSSPVITKRNSLIYSISEVSDFSCKIKAVDVYGQKSVFSDATSTISNFVIYRRNVVEIFSSGSSVTDTESYKSALEFLETNYPSIGVIIFKGGSFIINQIPGRTDMGNPGISLDGEGNITFNSHSVNSSFKEIRRVSLYSSNSKYITFSSGNGFLLSGFNRVNCTGQISNFYIKNCSYYNYGSHDGYYSSGKSISGIFEEVDQIRCGELSSITFKKCRAIYSEYLFESSFDWNESIIPPGVRIIIAEIVNSKINVIENAASLVKFQLSSGSTITAGNIYVGELSFGAYGIRIEDGRTEISESSISSYFEIILHGSINIVGSNIFSEVNIEHYPSMNNFGAPSPCRHPYSRYMGEKTIKNSSLTARTGRIRFNFIEQYDYCESKNYYYSYTNRIYDSVFRSGLSNIVFNGTLVDERNSFDPGFSVYFSPSGEHS